MTRRAFITLPARGRGRSLSRRRRAAQKLPCPSQTFDPGNCRQTASAFSMAQ
jgi:hypothetical protein